jgi:hypothetical protein
METIKEAKDFLNKNYKDGVQCPCCNQYVKEYKRKIYSRIARMLISLYHLDRRMPGEYFHVDDITRGVTDKGPADFPKLVHWGLILEKPKDPNDKTKRTSGYWKITEQGQKYVEKKIAFPRYIHLLNGSFRKMSGPIEDIEQALGEDFNYEELMML